MTVSSNQRCTRQQPCRVCGGYDQAPRGQGKRCFGYLSDDGKYAHCTRDEYAGGLEIHPGSNTYAHWLQGKCRCGKAHGSQATTPKVSTNGHHLTIAATFDYLNEQSVLIYQTVTYAPKGFSQRRPNGNGGWIWNLEGVQPTLYRLPELLAADPGKPVFITEGEKHADRLIELGLVATSFPFGALKVHLVQNVSALKDRHVLVLPDNDEPGHRHGQQIAERLQSVAKSVRVLELPGLPEKGDILNWLATGNSIDTLMDLTRHCPEWKPDKTELLDGEPDSEEAKLRITPLQDVVPEKVEPLWPKRIFLGKLAVLAGDPGLGKSYASLDIAARVSVGGPWPDGSGYAPQGNVLLLSAEDGLADTIKPRLELLGADMSRIYSLGLTVSKGEEYISLSLQQHLPQIEKFIVEKSVILLVVDPLLAFTGKAVTHKSSEVRAVLSPMAAMAQRTRCAILAVMHPNKNSQEGNVLYRINASLDFAAAARSVMMAAKHPDNPHLRVMATVKCNLSAHPEPMAFGFTHDGRFAWQGVTEVDVSHLMAPPMRDEDRSELQEAINFLQTLLAKGPIAATQVEAERKEMGISERTLRRAKAALRVKSARFNKEGSNRGKGEWRWYMPETVQGGQTPYPTVGNLEDSRSNGHSPAIEEGAIFNIANGSLEDAGVGNLESLDSEGEMSTNPVQAFNIANSEGQDLATLNDDGEDSLEV